MAVAKVCIVGLGLLARSSSAQAERAHRMQNACQDESRRLTPTKASPGNPYGGAAAKIPGVIEAEEFDFGGEGEGYHDNSSGNSGGAFRDEDVDISARDNGYTVGWIREGEYLRYTVDVSKQFDAVDFSFLVSAPSGFDGSFRVVSGGTGCDDYTTDLSGLVNVPSTGGWDIYENVSARGTSALHEGSSHIWLCAASRGFNIDSFTMMRAAVPGTCGQNNVVLRSNAKSYGCVGTEEGPVNGTPATVPGLVNAVAFDCGGEGVAYHDSTTGNFGNVLRVDEDVDKYDQAEDGSYVVGWISKGESLRYTISVSRAVDRFYFIFRVGCWQDVNDAFHVVTGGSGCTDYTTDLSGPVSIAAADGYQNIGMQGIGGLPAGSASIWLCILNATNPGYNIGSITMLQDENST